MPLTNNSSKKVSRSLKNYDAAEKAFARRRVPHNKINKFRGIALDRITLGFEKTVLFMKSCAIVQRKLSQGEITKLEFTLKKLDKQLDSFLTTESAFLKTKSATVASRERIKRAFALARLLTNGAIELEQKGLVEKGFTHTVFRKIKNGKPIQN